MRNLLERRLGAGASWMGSLLLLVSQGCVAPGSAGDEVVAASSQAAGKQPTSFVSAANIHYGEEEEEEEEEESDGDRQEDIRETEGGDIYRALGGGHLLNLNPFQGLQVIDASNPATPKIISRLPVSGTPVDVYVDGTRAIVLLNDWEGYAGDNDKLAVPGFKGGTVLLVDIKNHQAPKVIARSAVPHSVRYSHYVDRGSNGSLYVAGLDSYGAGAIKSFEVTSSSIIERSELPVSSVRTFKAADHVLLLASYTDILDTRITILDASDIHGSLMVRGGTLPPMGQVFSPSSLDFRNNQLRVFSMAQSTQLSRFWTFDATDKDNITLIDYQDFGYAHVRGAVILENKAFAVAHDEGPPFHTFHTFSIDGSGDIAQQNETTLSGNNSLITPVLGGTRLIGIGLNDDGGRKVAVSLLDSNHLKNPTPIIARKAIDVMGNTSPRLENVDSRAFSVLENAVNVKAPTGETETGLVLVPFEAQKKGSWDTVTGVQMFTFSGSTLTRRGLMQHPENPRRAFRLEGVANHGVNLSDTVMTVQDLGNLASPTQKSILDLAPNFAQIIPWDNYRVRIRMPEGYAFQGTPYTAKAEVIAKSDDADMALPVATFDVLPSARYFRVGDLFVSVQGAYTGASISGTKVQVYDLSKPKLPSLKGQLTTSALTNGSWWGYKDPERIKVLAAKDSLVFYQDVEHWVTEDIQDTIRGVYPGSQCPGQAGCIYVGRERCSAPAGSQPYCLGGFAACTGSTCVPVDRSAVASQSWEYVDQYERIIGKWKAEVNVLNLSNPAQPTVVPGVAITSATEEPVNALSDGKDVYVTVSEPVTLANDARPHVKYYVKRIDLSKASQPKIGARINVPGELIDVDGDKLFTLDRQWGGAWQERAVARLDVDTGKNLAALESYEKISGRAVEKILVEDHKNVLLTHRSGWPYPGAENDRKFDILAPKGSGFELRSRKAIEPWMMLLGAAEERAFFSVPGGTLVVNIDDTKKPKAQAFLPFASSAVIHGDDILAAAGRYGIHQIDEDDNNLLKIAP